VGDEGADPDEVELGFERQGPQVGFGVDRVCAELAGAEIHPVPVEVAGGDVRIVVVGAQPAEHAAVSAGQIEDVRVVRLVAEFAGEMDQLQRPSSEIEILFLKSGRHHAVARGKGAVNRQPGKIVERAHGAQAENRGQRTGQSVLPAGAGPAIRTLPSRE
jgi:hypothetical protein